jgi:hypothetical protein
MAKEKGKRKKEKGEGRKAATNNDLTTKAQRTHQQ